MAKFNNIDSSDDESPIKHIRLPKHKAPKSEDEAVLESKKDRLPSSEEIYNRIKWDCSLDCDVDDFVICYEDRFIGLMEVVFSEWIIGAIPYHRVKSYKYKGKLIWDRTSRFTDFSELNLAL